MCPGQVRPSWNPGFCLHCTGSRRFLFDPRGRGKCEKQSVRPPAAGKRPSRTYTNRQKIKRRSSEEASYSTRSCTSQSERDRTVSHQWGYSSETILRLHYDVRSAVTYTSTSQLERRETM